MHRNHKRSKYPLPALAVALLAGLLLFTVMLPGTAAAQDTAVDPISRLGWLEGRWERLNALPGQTAYEEWSIQPGGLTGKGYALQESDTVFVEYLSILRIAEKLYYVAEVSHNAEPTRFEIIRITDSGFVSENPRHDFPKKIEYLRIGPERLQAIISGNGRSSTFTFRKSSD